MKRIILTIMITLMAVVGMAQSGSYRQINIYDHIRLKGVTVNTISTDTTFSAADDVSVPTARAVRDFVLNHAGSGSGDTVNLAGVLKKGVMANSDLMLGTNEYTDAITLDIGSKNIGIRSSGKSSDFNTDRLHWNNGTIDKYIRFGETGTAGNNLDMVLPSKPSGFGNAMGGAGYYFPLSVGGVFANSVGEIPAQSFSAMTGKPTTISGYGITDFNSLGDARYRPIGYVPTWTEVTSKPTIPTNTNQLTNGSGFITSVPAQSYSSLTGKPTTISGYGITDFNSLGDARYRPIGYVPTWTEVTSKPTIPTNTNQLTNGSGFITSVPAQSYSSLTGKPTTISGYGITDFNSLGDARYRPIGYVPAWSSVTGKPTTIAAAGITDVFTKTEVNTSLGAKLDSSVKYTLKFGYGINYNPADSSVSIDSSEVATQTDLANASGTQTLDQVTARDSVSTHQVTFSNLNLSKIRNFASDSLAVEGGLVMNDVYRNNSDLKIVSDLPDQFSILIQYIVGTTVPDFRIEQGSGNDFSINVDWGDGTVQKLRDTSSYQLTHTYAANGTYKVLVTFISPSPGQGLNVSSSYAGMATNGIVGFERVDKIPYLFLFSLYAPGITTFNGLNPTFYAATQYLSFKYTNITSFNPTVALPSGLKSLDLSNTAMTGFAPSIALPAGVNDLHLGYNGWSVATVNTVLQFLDAATFSAGAKVLNIKQTPAATPTGAGATAVTSLQSKGWTITKD